MGLSRIYKLVEKYKDKRDNIVKTLKIQEVGELVAEILKDAGMKKGSSSEKSSGKKYWQNLPTLSHTHLYYSHRSDLRKKKLPMLLKTKIAYLNTKQNYKGLP